MRLVARRILWFDSEFWKLIQIRIGMKKIMFNDLFNLTKLVLVGRKNMTRRFINGNYTSIIFSEDKYFGVIGNEEDYVRIMPKYNVGEVVAIAQSYKDLGYDPDALDRDPKDLGIRGFMQHNAGWNNKMFVKAYACKHHIKITNVKVERLQDISDEDCLKEGIYRLDSANGSGGIAYSFVGASDKKQIGLYNTPREAFSVLIDKVSSKGTWDNNPFVWVYEFKRWDQFVTK